MISRLISITLLALVLNAPRGRAADLSGRNVQLRVMAKSVPVRAGPGGSYREIGRVGKGQVYQAIDRSHDGSWYRIRLSRGLTGWVLAELVWPFEVVDESSVGGSSNWLQRNVLGPSKLADGTVTMTLAAGVMDTDGLFSVRLGVQPSRHYLVEIVAGQAVGHLGSMLFYGGELLVFIGPWRTFVPFAAIGGGGSTVLPHREGRLFSESTRPMLSAGGGLLMAIKGQLTLRLDARQTLVFAEDSLVDLLSVTAGLMLTF